MSRTPFDIPTLAIVASVSIAPGCFDLASPPESEREPRQMRGDGVSESASPTAVASGQASARSQPTPGGSAGASAPSPTFPDGSWSVDDLYARAWLKSGDTVSITAYLVHEDKCPPQRKVKCQDSLILADEPRLPSEPPTQRYVPVSEYQERIGLDGQGRSTRQRFVFNGELTVVKQVGQLQLKYSGHRRLE